MTTEEVACHSVTNFVSAESELEFFEKSMLKI